MVEKYYASIRNRIYGNSVEWDEAATLINKLNISNMGVISLFIFNVSLTCFAAELVREYPNLTVDVSQVDETLLIDVGGRIWTLPNNGGQAIQITQNTHDLSQPRLSWDGTKILVNANSTESMTTMLVDLATNELYPLITANMNTQDAAWHPDGERVIYASRNHEHQLDIWEVDLLTGLTWRLTNNPDDDSSPVWSQNGRHLAWIRKMNDRYSLILRRHSEADKVVLESDLRISSLSWRPDNSLISFLRHHENKVTLDMVILSDPTVIKTLDREDKLVTAPVSWINRMTMFYTADGTIRSRHFGDRYSRKIHFRALIVE